MSTKVTSVPSVADAGAQAVPAREPVKASGSQVQTAQAPVDYRLVIEEDPTGGFVYKTLDRRTGEIVQQFPLENILRMKGEVSYSAGAIITARA